MGWCRVVGVVLFLAAVDGYCTGPVALRTVGSHSTLCESRRQAGPGITMTVGTGDFERRSAIGLFTSLLFVAGGPVSAKKTSATLEDTTKAYQSLLELQEKLDGADDLAAAKDWAGILALLEEPIFKGVESTLLTLVSGPVLSAEDKKTIGTRKRYGVAADVLYGIGGVQAAIASIDDPQLQACSGGQCSGDFVSAEVEVPKTLKSLKAALREIIGMCKSYKEFK
mmetsp:Transcript_46922/g.112747  ORF Transcript_46922/g.112747 Transcript_46922/m.112747 type:complete len:225 (-) Transcript_46922:2653-3327(-)